MENKEAQKKRYRTGQVKEEEKKIKQFKREREKKVVEDKMELKKTGKREGRRQARAGKGCRRKVEGWCTGERKEKEKKGRERENRE